MADYCIVVIDTFLVNNLTRTVTSRDWIYLWNPYRNNAINNCNFSRTMDIGYGSCTPYEFDTAKSIYACICSTNRCSDTYSSCQASVNQALSSPPPLLPVLQPTLSNTITCQDFYATRTATYNITDYLDCALMVTFGKSHFSKCSAYTPNHTILCGVFYDTPQGSFQQVAMIEGDYELLMYSTIVSGVLISNGSLDIYQYETPTSIATLTINNSAQYTTALCLCTTNNCNVDIATCTNGMNIPSYFFTFNGSTSSTSTVSTSGTSTVEVQPLLPHRLIQQHEL